MAINVYVKEKVGRGKNASFSEVERQRPMRLPVDEIDYGRKLRDRIRPYMKDAMESRKTYRVEVFWDEANTGHSFMIVPKSGGIMVTDNVAECHQFDSYIFDKMGISYGTAPERTLVCINPDHNNNKIYIMKKVGTHWGANYGRNGSQPGDMFAGNLFGDPYEYENWLYWIKYEEKILKGYKDVSDLHDGAAVTGSGTTTITRGYESIADADIRRVIDYLMNASKKKITQSYTVSIEETTPAMIEEARKCVDKMRTYVKNYRKYERAKEATIAFNKQLKQLYTVLPRRIDGSKQLGVARMMAESDKDFADIIVREDDLITVMEGQVKVASLPKASAKDNQTVLDAMGVQIWKATDKQKEQVMRHLDSNLQPLMKNAYRVIVKKTQTRFDSYLDTHKGTKVKLFWHGSRDENWISIMQNGLSLNPDAHITGKMFGNGIYFAPSADKSFGYTSYSGSRWAHGSGSTAFMGLFATAYGTPYKVTSFNGNWSGYNYDRLQREHPGCDCVHADSSAGMLRKDEVVFYQESQMTLDYLVEFGASGIHL